MIDQARSLYSQSQSVPVSAGTLPAEPVSAGPAETGDKFLPGTKLEFVQSAAEDLKFLEDGSVDLLTAGMSPSFHFYLSPSISYLFFYVRWLSRFD